MQETPETWVPSLGQDDPLEQKMAICSSILSWRIPRTEEPNRLQSMELQRIGTTEHARAHTHTHTPTHTFHYCAKNGRDDLVFALYVPMEFVL